MPCWWGIVPGNTAWEIARHFLAPFVKDINQGGSDYFIKDNIEYSVTNFSASYEVVEYFDDGITNFGAVRGIVDSIWILPRGTEINYLVYQILTTYGEPEKVLVEVDVDYGLFHLFLSYPGLGIMALYEGEVEKAESHYEACLQDIGPELWLWSPGKFLGQKDGKPMEPDSVQNMRTIEEATAMTIEDFYQTYRLSDSTCLETPRDLWEAP